MAWNSRAEKFVKLAVYLYEKDWRHFKLQDGGWTDELEGEERIFGVFIRTMICNDSNAMKFFDTIGGFSGINSLIVNGEDVETYLSKEINKISMGSDRGSHRDNRHKRWTPRGIREYLEMVGDNQQEFLSNLLCYNDVFNAMWSLHGCGPLTAFDLCKRFFESNMIPYLPDSFYMTGSGEISGIKAIFPDANNEELVTGGNLIFERMLEAGIDKKVAYFGLEDLLCIYQKNKEYEEFLNCVITVENYASWLLDQNCIKERGIGC